MDICRNKHSGINFIFADELNGKYLLITPDAHIGTFHCNLFDEPEEVTNEDLVQMDCLSLSQINKYFEFLLIKLRERYSDFSKYKVDELEAIEQNFNELPLNDKLNSITLFEKYLWSLIK